jgi:tRNA(Ile)-lysidine synthase
MNLIPHVSKTIRTNKLFSKGDIIIVALSGGADSCALLDILNSLSDLSPSLVAVHINHCLRGEESDDDEEFARLFASSQGIPFESCRIDVAAQAKRHGFNLEDAGRRARLEYLEESRVKYKAHAIALAHHADDQAETVLMRLLRGSGMSGLSGMAVSNGHLIRPLLDITRHDIEQHLESRGLTYRQDSSNINTLFLRNRLRHELLPLLKEYNPNIYKLLNTTASLLADEDSLLDSIAETNLGESRRTGLFEMTLSVKWLSEQPVALRRRLVRKALERLAGKLDGFSYLHIKAILHILDSSRPNSRLSLPHGVTAVREYDNLIISCLPNALIVANETITVNKTGTYDLPNSASIVVSYCDDRPDFASLTPDTALIDLDKSPFPWKVRTFEPGDRIIPLGMRGSKKVKDLFIDMKIPLIKRKHLPIICHENNLIWVCGLCCSNLVRVDSSTRKIVKVVYRSGRI